MNILVLTGSYAPETGGIAELAQGLAGGLVANGAGVRIVSSTAGSAAFGSPSIPVMEFELPARGYLRRVAASRKAVLMAAREFDADRVIASSWSPFAVDLPTRIKGRPLPTDILCHGMDLLEPMRSVRYRMLLRRTLGRASRIVANSSFTADVARSAGAAAERTIVIHPGVDAERFRPAPRERRSERVLLSVGRLIERKGFDLVIRALSQVVDVHPSTHYLIVGDGPDRPRLERLARSKSVDKLVRFAGAAAAADLSGFYNRADIFVMPCRHIADRGDAEGFGIVFLEAACCELPCLAGRSGGTADAVEHGVTG